MTRALGILAVLVGFAMGSSQAEAAAQPESLPGVRTLTIEQFINIASEDNRPVIIDSRIAADYERGAIEQAVNMTDTEMTAEKLLSIAGKDEPIIFYCNGAECKRSAKACEKAVQWGWTNVMWFRGGISEWKANNLPLSR